MYFYHHEQTFLIQKTLLIERRTENGVKSTAGNPPTRQNRPQLPLVKLLGRTWTTGGTVQGDGRPLPHSQASRGCGPRHRCAGAKTLPSARGSSKADTCLPCDSPPPAAAAPAADDDDGDKIDSQIRVRATPLEEVVSPSGRVSVAREWCRDVSGGQGRAKAEFRGQVRVMLPGDG